MRVAWRVVVWSTLAVVLPAVAQAAGFDCDTASTPVQKLICSDRDLDKLDSDMTTMFADVVADGKTAQTDTSGIEHDQAAWARGRALCSNVNCLKAYYSRRLATLKEAYVHIRDSLEITASKQAKVNRHTWVGTWVAGYSCASAVDRIVVEKHMIKIGGGEWTPIDHQEEDTYHGLPVFYVEGRDTQANVVYDTHIDVLTYNKKGFGSGLGVTYMRCE